MFLKPELKLQKKIPFLVPRRPLWAANSCVGPYTAVHTTTLSKSVTITTFPWVQAGPLLLGPRDHPEFSILDEMWTYAYYFGLESQPRLLTRSSNDTWKLPSGPHVDNA